MKKPEQIVKMYCIADRITRDHMCCRFIGLRDTFDNIEQHGTVWIKSNNLQQQNTVSQTGEVVEFL